MTLEYEPVQVMPTYWLDEYGTYDVIVCTGFPQNVSPLGFINTILRVWRNRTAIVMDRFTPWDYPWCDSYMEKLYPILQWVTGVGAINGVKTGRARLIFPGYGTMDIPFTDTQAFATGVLFEYGRRRMYNSAGTGYNSGVSDDNKFLLGDSPPDKRYPNGVSQGEPAVINTGEIFFEKDTVITWLEEDMEEDSYYPIYVKRYKICRAGIAYNFTNDLYSEEFNILKFYPITHSVVATYLTPEDENDKPTFDLPAEYLYSNLDAYATETFNEVLTKYPELRQYVVSCQRKTRYEADLRRGYIGVENRGSKDNPDFHFGFDPTRVDFTPLQPLFSNLVYASVNPNEINGIVIKYAPNNFWNNETSELVDKTPNNWGVSGDPFSTSDYPIFYKSFTTPELSPDDGSRGFFTDVESGRVLGFDNVLYFVGQASLNHAELSSGVGQELPFRLSIPSLSRIASGSNPISFLSGRAYVNGIPQSEAYAEVADEPSNSWLRYDVFTADVTLKIRRHVTNGGLIESEDFDELTQAGAIGNPSNPGRRTIRIYEETQTITLNTSAQWLDEADFNPTYLKENAAINHIFNEKWKLDSNDENEGVMPDSLRIKEIHEALEAHRFTGADVKLKISTDGDVQEIPNTLAAQIEYTQEAIGGFNFPGEFTSGRYASTEPQEPIKFNNLPDFINKIYQELQASLGAGYHEISTGEETKATYTDISDMMDDLLRMVSVCYSLVSDSRVADARMQYMIFEIIKALGVRANLNTLPVGFEGEVAVVPGFDMASPSVMQAVRDILLNLQLLTKGAEREFYDKEFYESES